MGDTARIAPRPRGYVRATGPDAEAYLQRMVSNDVAVAVGNSCDALLLTPKGRVIAPLRVVRRAEDDFLLLTEPELGEPVLSELVRFRFAAKVDLDLEAHESHVILGRDAADGFAVRNPDYGIPAVELIDAQLDDELPEASADELERLRVIAGTPRFGREIDDRVLPAEAGLAERFVSFTKGCYPGQEPIARLHYRGHVNRRLRRLVIDAADLPAYDTELRHGERVVGRVTSAVHDDGRIVALGYVRTDVPDDAELTVDGGRARLD